MNIKKWESLLDLQQIFYASHLEFTKEYITLLKNFAPAGKYKELLDIGCGEGPEEIVMLSKEGYDVTGITIIPWMIKGNPQIKLMDMHDMQFLPNSFDAIYSAQVMEHSYAPWLACLEIWVTLRIGGIFFMVVPVPKVYRVVTHPNLLTQEQWNFILHHTGFKIIHNEVKMILKQPLIVIAAQKVELKGEVMPRVLNELTKIRAEKNE